MRKALIVPEAAKLGGHYSHAVIANGFVYVSRLGPANPKTGVAPDAFAEQVRQTCAMCRTILRGAGADMKDVVKVNAYLSDLTRFAEYNLIYREIFPGEPPARTTIGCQLLRHPGRDRLRGGVAGLKKEPRCASPTWRPRFR